MLSFINLVQCNSKLKYKSVEYSKEAETDKLMKLILNDVCGSGNLCCYIKLTFKMFINNNY